LHWLSSPSSLDPDFAGYRVQRKVLFGTSWLDLNAELHVETFYIDDTVELDKFYFYRINSFDTAGHETIGLPYYMAPGVLPDSRPAVKVDMPDGPFFGPVEL